MEKPSTYTGPRFTLLCSNGSYSQLSSGIRGVVKPSVIPLPVSLSHSSMSTSVNQSSVDSPSVATSSIRNSSSVSPSSVLSSAVSLPVPPSSILQPVKKSVPQAEIPGTILATSHEVTLLEFIKELSNYGINLDSPITSISIYKDGTTGYNIIGNQYQILERPKTFRPAICSPAFEHGSLTEWNPLLITDHTIHSFSNRISAKRIPGKG